MELEQITALLAAFDQSTAVRLRWKSGDQQLTLEKAEAFPAPVAPAAVAAAPVAAAAVPAPAAAAAAPAQAPAAPAAQEEGEAITAPLIGTFYAASAPDKAPFVAVGDKVKAGQTVCLLEAMKMISEVPAPFDCVIEEVVAENGQLAAFGDVLFRVRRV